MLVEITSDGSTDTGRRDVIRKFQLKGAGCVDLVTFRIVYSAIRE